RIEHLTTDQKAGGSSPSERATSPQARGRFSRVRGDPFRCREAGPLTISHSLLGDLVNAGEGSAPLLKVRVARVDVGALGERGVVVAGPFADDGDRHARVL